MNGDSPKTTSDGKMTLEGTLESLRLQTEHLLEANEDMMGRASAYE